MNPIIVTNIPPEGSFQDTAQRKSKTEPNIVNELRIEIRVHTSKSSRN